MTMIHYEMNASLGGMIHWINSVYVKEEYRKKGIFRQMYEHIKLKAQEDNNVKAIRLYVDLDNETAQKVYKRLGMDNIEDNYDFHELDLHF